MVDKTVPFSQRALSAAIHKGAVMTDFCHVSTFPVTAFQTGGDLMVRNIEKCSNVESEEDNIDNRLARLETMAFTSCKVYSTLTWEELVIRRSLICYVRPHA